MTQINLDALRERWAAEGADSDLGLWWLADDLRTVLGNASTEAEVRSATLEVLRPLLESGQLRAVSMLEGGKFAIWTDDVNRQLEIISDRWKQVGKPDIGDIVWFIGERS